MAGETGQDDQIIELTEVVDEASGVTDTSSDEKIIELTDIDTEAVDAEIDGVTAADAWGEKPLAEDALPIAASISMEQLEAALEKVIERMFAEKIEPMMFDVMERVIRGEVEKIKQVLQKDLDQIHSS
jgi:hypothetical protein